MTMAIEQKRIEAAARAMYADAESYGDERFPWDDLDSIVGEKEAAACRENFRSIARAGVSAAFPELASDPPTGWVAPIEPSHATLRAMQGGYLDGGVNTARKVWQAARDAHTKEQTL